MYDNPWLFNDVPLSDVPKGMYGFVYLISDTISGKKYIGRKYFWTSRMQKTGRKKRAESDWKKYYSSNDWINQQLKQGRDPQTFVRQILYLCPSKGETNYLEIDEQFKRDVLRDPLYLNDNINGKWFKKNVSKYQSSSLK